MAASNAPSMTLHFTGRAELMASADAWRREWVDAWRCCDTARMSLAWRMTERLVRSIDAAALRDAPMDGEGNAKGSV